MEAAAQLEKRVHREQVEPKYLLNRFNGLFKNNQEVTKALGQGIHEILGRDAKEIRQEQLRLYYELTKNVLGIDHIEHPEQDPFFQVTGASIKEVYVDKHDLLKNLKLEKDIVLMGTTVLLRGDYLLETGPLRGRGEKFDHGVVASKEFEGDEMLEMDLFDPITINKERDWIMQFGFLGINKKRKGPEQQMEIDQGVVVLEPGVLELISQSPESANISQKLQEILTWFNHDLISHGTFLPRFDSDKKILEASGGYKLMDQFSNFSTADRDSFGSAFAGELWSLNLQESVFQKIVAERPAVVRFLRAHLDSYARSVESAVQDIGDKVLAKDVRAYLLKVYAFGFFRLVNPKDFNMGDTFVELRKKYPDLADLGKEEDKTRAFTFGEQGLFKNEKGVISFTPHSEVFAEFTAAFGGVERFHLLSDKFRDWLLYRDGEVLDSEREYLHQIFKKYTPKALAEFVYDKFYPALSSMGKNYRYYYDRVRFLEKHSSVVLRVLFDKETTSANFMRKVYRGAFGFLEKKLIGDGRWQGEYREDRRSK